MLNENRQRIQVNSVEGPADLVVEIVSPESIERDYETKLQEYAVAGVREYWLLDPLKSKAIFYALGESGVYHALPTDSQGRLASQLLPGFALQPDLLWREDPPTGPELIALVQAMIA